MTESERNAKRAERNAKFDAITNVGQCRTFSVADLTTKQCKVCKTVRTIAEFLALPPPANGVKESDGMQWRNCTTIVPETGRPCDATLTI